MSLPKLEKQDIIDALKYIDENGVPSHNQSMKYDLVSEDGKKYPPKYVLALANNLAHGSEIDTHNINAQEAVNYLQDLGYEIELKVPPVPHNIDKDKETLPLPLDLGKYKNPYSKMLIESKNLIFHGAPGTGKSYLAKEIAADIVSDGKTQKYDELTDEQKRQVEFVQFHPNYDYSDFVEGLRPKVNEDGSMGFELRDGIFKEFVSHARKNYEDSQKSIETLEKENSVQESMSEFFSGLELGVSTFKSKKGRKYTVTGVDERHIYVFIPENEISNKLILDIADIKQMLELDQEFEKVTDLRFLFGNKVSSQKHSYEFALYKEILKRMKQGTYGPVKAIELKKYVFIIDEINRGEISKIFGELFFSIDPGYRGRAGEVSTQYANLHDDPNDKFYVPGNVYIIGTMNDIDRSVDSFDFAMRRRFRFVELKTDDRCEMLSVLGDEKKKEAIRRMGALNKAIANVEDLNENYQIGASYFLKLETLDYDELWTDYLEPLLREYVRGMYDESELMRGFAKAYGYQESVEVVDNGASQDQG